MQRKSLRYTVKSCVYLQLGGISVMIDIILHILLLQKPALQILLCIWLIMLNGFIQVYPVYDVVSEIILEFNHYSPL